MGGQNRQLAEDQGQLPVVGVTKVKANPLRILHRHLADVGVVAAVERVTLGGQQLKGKADILGGDRFAILEAGFLAQVEDDVTAVLRGFDGLGNQSVGGKWLIVGGHGQGVVQIGADAGGGDTADYKRIEGVIAIGDHRQAQHPTFWRVRVDVVEVAEAGGRLVRRAWLCHVGVLRPGCGRLLTASLSAG